MKDKKLFNLKEVVKDTKLITQYFENPEEVMERCLEMESEATRLQFLAEVVKKTVRVKNIFFEKIDTLESDIETTNKQLSLIDEQRGELLEQLAKQRLLTLQLSSQLVSTSELIKQNKLNPEQVEKMLERSKQFVARCMKCKHEEIGNIDEMLKLGDCHCKGQFELLERVLA